MKPGRNVDCGIVDCGGLVLLVALRFGHPLCLLWMFAVAMFIWSLFTFDLFSNDVLIPLKMSTPLPQVVADIVSTHVVVDNVSNAWYLNYHI